MSDSCNPNWNVARQAPLSLGFSRQEYWSGLPFPSPGSLPDPGHRPGSPALQADSLPIDLQGKPYFISSCCCCWVTSVVSDSVRPRRRQPTRMPCPWDSPGKNTGVGCHFLLQCMKVKSESEVTQSCLTLSDPIDCSPPGSSIYGIFQARVLEWGTIAFSDFISRDKHNSWMFSYMKILGQNIIAVHVNNFHRDS